MQDATLVGLWWIFGSRVGDRWSCGILWTGRLTSLLCATLIYLLQSLSHTTMSQPVRWMLHFTQRLHVASFYTSVRAR